MKVQLLIPGMKKGNKADPRAEIFGIGSQLLQGFGARLEKQIVRHGPIVQRHEDSTEDALFRTHRT